VADLNTASFKEAPTAAEALRGNLDESDARVIRMLVTVGDRRQGAVYTVDSSLARHYVEVTQAAVYVNTEEKEKPVTNQPEPEPEAITDRAMTPPPRGRRK